MTIALRKAPEWLILAAPAALPPQSVTVLRPQVTAAAPRGDSPMALTFEIRNLHVAPGRNLEVTLPLTLRNE